MEFLAEVASHDVICWWFPFGGVLVDSLFVGFVCSVPPTYEWSFLGRRMCIIRFYTGHGPSGKRMRIDGLMEQ